MPTNQEMGNPAQLANAALLQEALCELCLARWIIARVGNPEGLPTNLFLIESGHHLSHARLMAK